MKKLIHAWRFRSCLASATLLGALVASSAFAQDFPTTLSGDHPLFYWPFSESTVAPPLAVVSNATAAVGSGYICSDVTLGQPGIVGNCALFDNPDFANAANVGNAGSKIEIPWNAAFNPVPPFSVEFWAKPRGGISTDSTGLCAVSSMNPYFYGANRSGYIFYLGASGWLFRVGGQNSYVTSANPSFVGSTHGGWDHVVGEFDGTNIALYVNGTLASTEAASPGFVPNGIAPIRIGSTLFYGNYHRAAFGLPGPGNRGWDGWVDELAVYSKLLSSNQISAHFSAASTNNAGYHAQIMADSPAGYWTLDEGPFNPATTNSVAADLGTLGAAGDGTNTLGAEAGQAPPPYAGFPAGSHSVFYSGSEGSMLLSPNTATNIIETPPSEITYLAWIKPTAINGWKTIIEQGWDPSTTEENYFRISDTLDWEGTGEPNTEYYEVGAFNGSAYASAVYPVPPGDIGNWVFLAGTWDGTSWNLYRDGAFVAGFADTGGPVVVAGSPPWSVGSLSNPDLEDAWNFAGTIAQPAILTNALNASQILALYNAAKVSPVITTPVAAPTSPVYLGSSYTFSVGADGVQPLSYEWLSNGIAVAGQSGSSFTISDVGPGANGTYSVVVTNLYGAATSAVVFAVTPSLPPVSVTPTNETRWNGYPFEFSAAGVGTAIVNYQWDLNGSSVPSANASNIVGTATSSTVGTYSVVLNNPYGSITSSVPGVLSIKPIPTGYATTILGDHPIAYYRLDETSGTVCHDYAGGNDGVYNDVILDQPGYVPASIDPDPAVTFLGITNSYVGNIAPTSINFAGTTNFTIEAWANGGPNQENGAALVAKGTGNVGNGGIANEQFTLAVNGSAYSFLVRSPANTTANGSQATGTTGPDGTWHYVVGEWDGANVTLWVDGVQQASVAGPSSIRSSTFPISIGAERSGNDPHYDLDYNGTIDEVAIYNYALSSAQIQSHYAAAYGSSLSPQVSLQPQSVTQYQGLAVTLDVAAYGSVPITYQWNKVGSGAISGATSTTLTLSDLALSDSGTYFVGITNAAGGTNTQPFTITVLPPPSSPPAIDSLVVHLPFDGNLIDATGRGNNGTNEASGAYTPANHFVSPGKVGSSCLAYETDTNAADTNVSAYYVSLGLRPDLQFSSNVNFSVVFWIQEPSSPNFYTGNDLPFFTDTVGSTFGFGYVFAPSYGGPTPDWPGGWAYSIFDASGAGAGVYGDLNWLNDGNWHHLAYVMDRKLGATVYVDGISIQESPGDLPAEPFLQGGTSITAAGDIDNGNAATIGQDPTGTYAQLSNGQFLMDDFAVFRKSLTPLEVGAIYSAGNESPAISFTGLASGTFSYTLGTNNTLILNWTAGTLQSSTNVAGPYNNTTATSPYTVPETNQAAFFRVKF